MFNLIDKSMTEKKTKKSLYQQYAQARKINIIVVLSIVVLLLCCYLAYGFGRNCATQENQNNHPTETVR
jgi:putative uncharacterized protein trwL